MTDLHDLPAAQLLTMFASKTLSPLEYYQHLVDHIGRWEPHINALWNFDPQGVMEQARGATERWARGLPRGPLDGVPVTLKELIATQGQPIPLGSAATVLQPAAQDAPPAARLREAGAIVLGKTTVPDFGMLSSGLSSFHGVTRNPWNLANNTGGSSSGAAAAAAAGYGPLHVGTDIGGSIRLPAGWCGLVGFKPTLGRVPIDPYYTGRCAGPMTRSLDDCALLMRYLSLPDSRDATSLAPQALDWKLAPPSMRGLRVGVLLDPGVGFTPSARTCALVEAAAKHFQAHGARLQSIAPLMDRTLLEGMDRFWRARQWAELSAMGSAQFEKVLPYIREWAAPAADFTAVQAVQGFNQTFEMRRRAAAVFDEVDLLLCPTNQVDAFPAEWSSPGNDPQQPFEHIVFTLPWNMGEQPALSINCGFTEHGMPVGLQLVGPRFADEWLLQMGKWYEGVRGEMPAWPTPPHA